jgi:hypothetical protein
MIIQHYHVIFRRILEQYISIYTLYLYAFVCVFRGESRETGPYIFLANNTMFKLIILGYFYPVSRLLPTFPFTPP